MNRTEIEARLLALRIIDANSCWIHCGSRDDGYGVITVNYEQYKVHRLSAWLYLGLSLEDATSCALHKDTCKSRRCWNPEHLYVGTRADNNVDRSKSITHCLHGHEYTKQNTGRGVTGRRCRECEKLAQRKRRNKQTKKD